MILSRRKRFKTSSTVPNMRYDSSRFAKLFQNYIHTVNNFVPCPNLHEIHIKSCLIYGFQQIVTATTDQLIL